MPGRLVLACQRHKSNGSDLTRDELVLQGLFDQEQLLSHKPTTDRDDHPAAGLELRKKRWRHMTGRRGDDDRIIRRVFLPTVVTITKFGRDVAITQTT